MRLRDLGRYSLAELSAYPARTALILLAMSIGIASVIALTALGDSARRYVVDQFASLGTNLLIVIPGRNETTGAVPPLFGETARDLTLDDAFDLTREPGIKAVAPLTVGQVSVAYREKTRTIDIIGATDSLRTVRNLHLQSGRFLDASSRERASSQVVLGAGLAKELFATDNPLGKRIRVGNLSFRVVGILERKGRGLGMDLSDTAIIPVLSANGLFHTDSLFRILVEVRSGAEMTRMVKRIEQRMRTRHDGELDITVLSQDAMLAVFEKIFKALTAAVGAIAGISLAVAGVLIMNVMLVSVAQRTPEIGLLKAIGASPAQILSVFLSEAVILSVIGSLIGLLLVAIAAALVRHYLPDFPVSIPPWSVLMALLIATATGLLFGLWPARKAARKHAIDALQSR